MGKLNEMKKQFNIGTSGMEESDQPVGITPSSNLLSKPGYKNIARLADNISEMSTSPIHTGKMSNAFRTKFGNTNIPTPMGSDISRSKFDFKDYDPNARKKKAPSPVRKVKITQEEDMEVFTTDPLDGKQPIDIEEKNHQQSEE